MEQVLASPKEGTKRRISCRAVISTKEKLYVYKYSQYNGPWIWRTLGYHRSIL